MIIPAIVLGCALSMWAVELVRPGRAWPQVTGWIGRAALLNGVQVGIVLLAGVTWDGWFKAHRPWSADGLGTAGGAVVGYLAVTFVYYWWHRWRHDSPFLWRWLHQVHHSPQRIEVITSFYKHPLEIVANGLLSSAIVYLLVGLGPAAAAQAILLTGLAELFYHWNIPTPHWIGYLIQRPESHCVHHEAGHHSQNYGDLPLYDILFGTFYNPKEWQKDCGFGAAEHRLGAMLTGVEVSASSEQSR